MKKLLLTFLIVALAVPCFAAVMDTYLCERAISANQTEKAFFESILIRRGKGSQSITIELDTSSDNVLNGVIREQLDIDKKILNGDEAKKTLRLILVEYESLRSSGAYAGHPDELVLCLIDSVEQKCVEVVEEYWNPAPIE